MASFESSIPPSTHCSAATSCGGVRSKSSFRGAISATLTRFPLPVRVAPLPTSGARTYLLWPYTVVADGTDILPARHAGHQVTQWTGMWTKCADTPAKLCAAWGQNCGDDHHGHSHMAVSRDDVIHRLCGRKTSGEFPG